MPKNGFSTESKIVAAAQILTAAFAALSVAAAPASAQVVITTGVQGYYDDNIFQESGKEIAITDANQSQIEQLSEKEIKQVDGKKDNDWVTNPTLSLSGARPIGNYGNLQMNTQAGFLVFNDNDDENRFTLDGVLHYETSEAFLPKPFYVILEDSIDSQEGDISVAEGSASRQTQVNLALLNAGVRQVQLARDTNLTAAYQFQVHTYLGEFLLGGGGSSLLDEKGADYLQNSIDLVVDRQITKSLSGGIYGNFAVLSYSSVDDDPLHPDKVEQDQDRYQSSDGARLLYKVTDKLSIGGSAGIDYSKLKEDPLPQEVVVVGDDGSVSTISEAVDSNETSFAYTGTVSYSPFVATGIMADVRQAIATDIDGDRFTTQTYSLNLSQGLTDWSTFGASARYTGFDRNDSLGDPTDRLELMASVRFTITQTIALTAGYSYIDQNADEIDGATLVRSNEYDDNRIFISLSAGLVGLPG